MLSRIIRTVPLEDVLGQDNWVPIINEDKVQQQIDRYCLQFKTYQPQKEVAIGDIVTADLTSENPFFNRNIKIKVGKGFFEKEFEEKLSGVILGERTVIEHSEAGAITVTVTDIQRLQVPALTDELVERGKPEGIRTAEEYRRHIRRESVKEDILDKVYDYLNIIISQSDFDIDESEIEALLEQEMERCRQIARTQGMVFDEMSKEQLLGSVGQPDIPSFKNMVREMEANQISAALLALHWQNQDPGDTDVGIIMELNDQATSYLYKKMINNYAL